MQIIPNNAQVIWDEGKSSHGSVRGHAEQDKLVFIQTSGQTLDHCPQTGAVLQVDAPLEPDRFLILKKEQEPSSTNRWYLTVSRLPADEA